jgi:hypothetical protein
VKEVFFWRINSPNTTGNTMEGGGKGMREGMEIIFWWEGRGEGSRGWGEGRGGWGGRVDQGRGRRGKSRVQVENKGMRGEEWAPKRPERLRKKGGSGNPPSTEVINIPLEAPKV